MTLDNMICWKALLYINLFPNNFAFLPKTAASCKDETVRLYPKKFHRTTLTKPCDLALKNGYKNTYLFLDHIKTGTEKIESVYEHARSEIKTLDNKREDTAILLHIEGTWSYYLIRSQHTWGTYLPGKLFRWPRRGWQPRTFSLAWGREEKGPGSEVGRMEGEGKQNKIRHLHGPAWSACALSFQILK